MKKIVKRLKQSLEVDLMLFSGFKNDQYIFPQELFLSSVS